MIRAGNNLKNLLLRLNLSKDAKRIFPNSAWQVGEKFIRIFFGVLIMSLVARYLGPGNFGLLNMAIAFVAIWSALSTMGMHEIAVKELITTPEENSEIIVSTLILQIFGGLLVLILATSSSFLVNVEQRSFPVLVAIVSAAHLFRSATAFKYWFDSRLESRYVAVIEGMAFLLISLVRIILVYTGAALVYFAFVILLESVFFAVGISIVFFKRKNRPIFDSGKALRIRHLIKSGWPIALSGFAITIYMRIDQVMLGALSGAESAGIYSAAVRFSEVWYFIPVVLVSSSFPVLLEVRKRDYNLYENKIQRLYSALNLLAILVAVFVTLFSGLIVNLLLGSEYSATATVLSLHVWNGIFVSLGVVSVKYMVGENMEKLILVLTFSGVVLNVLLNFFLIPRYGPIGAALATLVSQAMITIAFDAGVPGLRKNFYMKLRALVFWKLV